MRELLPLFASGAEVRRLFIDEITAIGAVEFGWFPRSFPRETLTVIRRSRFSTSQITGVTIEDFLLGASV